MRRVERDLNQNYCTVKSSQVKSNQGTERRVVRFLKVDHAAESDTVADGLLSRLYSCIPYRESTPKAH